VQRNEAGGIGGGIGKAPEGYEGHVTFYVYVPDVAAALGKIESIGGKKMMGPDQVPDGPIIALFEDPEGHVIGLVHDANQPNP
jgi:predicted enzyme related to lactoylglutathione lyase